MGGNDLHSMSNGELYLILEQLLSIFLESVSRGCCFLWRLGDASHPVFHALNRPRHSTLLIMMEIEVRIGTLVSQILVIPVPSLSYLPSTFQSDRS